MKKSRGILIGTGAGIGILALVALLVLAWLRAPRLTPELRGHDLAAELGCFACHGPGGTGGVPNPGSEEKEVPSWDGGTAMMYVNNEAEIREWILDGHPKRLRNHQHTEDESPHELPFHMPAFRSVINDDQLADLVAYYKVVANYRNMPDAARAGYDVARRSGCFGCHGAGGLVGHRNPRAFKGYIPPWRGGDFRDLVRGDDELHQWIREGRIDRLESNPAARWFTRRQVIQMPAYGETLSDEEIGSLMDYIRWLQEESSD